ncbi:magnetosome biogenesis CDF transporter MamB [Magnetococcales bacterium HHB-1]
MKYDYCSDCRQEVTWWSIGINIFLVIYKGTLGAVTGCAALVADAFHSSADVIASSVTMVSIRVSNRPSDEKHAYGYGKIQHISSLIVGILLFGGGVLILVDAVSSIITGDYDAPHYVALVGALVSVLSNELMFRYQSCVAIENNSPAIMANAWDNRSDAISSVGVMIGILFATVLGFPIADPLAAIGVAYMVMKIGFELSTEAVDHLMDSAPESEEVEEIYGIIKKIPKIHRVNYLRARSLGEKLYVELDIDVESSLKVYESDLIVESLKQKIFQHIEHVGQVQVFVSPSEEDPGLAPEPAL